MKVVFSEEDQKTVAWAWQRGETYAVDMSEAEVMALANWIEANTERIYNSVGDGVPPESRAMSLVARLRGMLL